MSNPYADLDRPPLSVSSLRAALLRPDGVWGELRVVAETGSTNDDLVVSAADRSDGSVLVAESQVSGRGRAGRTWVSPPRAGIIVSVLLRPHGVGRALWGWLPLLTGVAVADAVGRIADIDVGLKWPNDVLAGVGARSWQPGSSPLSTGSAAPSRTQDDRKLGGILVQVTGAAVVIGIGLNVSTRADELPGPSATSLVLEGAECLDRDPLLRGVLRSLADSYTGWLDAGGDPDHSGLRAAYESRSATLGFRVEVSLPGGTTLQGTATAIDGTGRLVVMTDDGATRAVAAGDVLHVRRGSPDGGMAAWVDCANQP